MSVPPPGGFPTATTNRLREGAFLLIDKPRGPSSHQVTAWVRDLLGVDRAGHAGTLDPNVSGVLWVGVGPALKLLPLMLEFPKRYVAVVALHAEASGKDVDRVLGEFVGPVFQTPPVRSAVKRERRIRTIHRLKLLERTATRLLIELAADSGTYVRTLAVDVGEALGVGGHMEELRRTGTGPFTEASAVPLATLADAVTAAHTGDDRALVALLHPIDEVWREFPRVVVRDAAAAAVAHGADLAVGGIQSMPNPFAQGAHVVLVSRAGELVALGEALFDSAEVPLHKHGWVIDATRVLVDPARFPITWRTPVTAKTHAPAAPGVQ